MSAFLLILLIPAGAYKILCLLWHVAPFSGDLVLLMVIFAAGIHLFALFWRMLERESSSEESRGTHLLFVSVDCAVSTRLCRSIYFHVDVRIIMIVLYSIVSAWLVFKFDRARWVSSAIAIAVPVWFVLLGDDYVSVSLPS